MPAEGVPEKPLVVCHVTSVGPPDARRLLFRPSTGARLLPRLLSLNHIEKMGKVRQTGTWRTRAGPQKTERCPPRSPHPPLLSPVGGPGIQYNHRIQMVEMRFSPSNMGYGAGGKPLPTRDAHYLDAAFPLAPSSRDSNRTTFVRRSTASRHQIRRDLDARAGTGGEPCRRGARRFLAPIRAVRRADPRPRPRRRSLAIECRSLPHPSDRACSESPGGPAGDPRPPGSRGQDRRDDSARRPRGAGAPGGVRVTPGSCQDVGGPRARRDGGAQGSRRARMQSGDEMSRDPGRPTQVSRGQQDSRRSDSRRGAASSLRGLLARAA